MLQHFGGLLDLAVTFFQQVEHGIKLLSQLAEFILGVHHADALAFTGFNRLDYAVNTPDRVSNQAGAA